MNGEVVTFFTVRIRPERGATAMDLRQLFRDLESETPSVLATLYFLLRLEPFNVRLSPTDSITVRLRLANHYCPFHEDLTDTQPIYSE